MEFRNVTVQGLKIMGLHENATKLENCFSECDLKDFTSLTFHILMSVGY